MISAPPPQWNAHRVTAVTCAALLPPLITGLIMGGLAEFGTFGLALLLGILWPLLFSVLRRSVFNWHGPITAMVFALLLPASTPLWQAALALSFGLVFGNLIFGGHGRSFLNGATVGLAFLLFSFPAAPSNDAMPQVALAAAFSGAILMAAGLLSWRIVAGFGLCLAALLQVVPASPDEHDLQNASFILGLVFLIGDPVAGASTHLGRWLYGALAAALVVVLGQAGDGFGALPAVVFGALLASIFAPLLDQIAIHANQRRRARRQSLEP